MKANNMKRFLLALLFVPVTVFASGAALHLDRAPNVQDDPAALQNGAKLFVNYCLNCHGLSFVRYNRLTELGLTDQQVRDNLMFTADKIGEPIAAVGGQHEVGTTPGEPREGPADGRDPGRVIPVTEREEPTIGAGGGGEVSVTEGGIHGRT